MPWGLWLKPFLEAIILGAVINASVLYLLGRLLGLVIARVRRKFIRQGNF
jgi:hypothetical protein